MVVGGGGPAVASAEAPRSAILATMSGSRGEERSEADREPVPLPGDDGAALGELDPATAAIVERVAPLTMTGPSRIVALVEAVRHCVRAGVPGAFAECGVWRGGSVLAMIATLQELGVEDRPIYLYDTFEGMTEPTEHDTSPYHPPATELWRESSGNPWGEILFDGQTNSEPAVRAALEGTGYPMSLVELVRGPVEQTLPGAAPDGLALLRLDTDWYESTLHELRHLFPRLARGGVLIVDDYGHWEGCRRAVDEYFSTEADPVLLQRIDYAARLAVKA